MAAAVALTLVTSYLVDSKQVQFYSAEEVTTFQKWNTKFNKKYSSPAEKV